MFILLPRTPNGVYNPEWVGGSFVFPSYTEVLGKQNVYVVKGLVTDSAY